MKDYQQTIQYLYNLQYSGIKLGLKNVTQLLDYWNNPQKNFPAIHIAGTNGKGSVAAYLHAILCEAGYCVGIYTSPHLVDFTERIRINDERISWKQIVDYTTDLRKEIDKNSATFFEATSAIAFRFFSEKKVDIAVIETGMGGRLDATNLVHPLSTIITSISKDHTQFLGNNLKNITQEKAGIIKPKIPCVTINQNKRIIDIIKGNCKEKAAPFHMLIPAKHIEILKSSLKGNLFNLRLPQIHFRGLEIPLAGTFQVWNAALALLSLHFLADFPVSEAQMKAGLKKTKWPGRLQKIQDEPLTILDVAHNPEGFSRVFSFLNKEYQHKKIWALLGLSKDKEYKKIIDTISKNVSVLGVVNNFSEKAMPSGLIIKEVKKRMEDMYQFQSVEEGFFSFRTMAEKKDILLIIGSHYLAGDFLQKIQFT
jgi:dihydrofolate synthase/folylpolyglutamate synthase